MCRYDTYIWSDCVYEQTQVSPKSLDQYEEVQGSIGGDGKYNRIKYGEVQTLANHGAEKESNPVTVIEGACGREGCVLKEAGHLEKPINEAFKNYLRVGVQYFNTSWEVSNTLLPEVQKSLVEAAFGNPTLVDEDSRNALEDLIEPMLNGLNGVQEALVDHRVKKGKNPTKHVERLCYIKETLRNLKEIEAAVNWRMKEAGSVALCRENVVTQRFDSVGILLDAARIDAARSWVEAVDAMVPGFNQSSDPEQACKKLFSPTSIGHHFF